MGTSKRPSLAIIMAWLTLMQGLLVAVNGHFNYKDALAKSIIFLEAQRSGKLPPNNRLPWRGDSALEDGKLVNVDLVGGYYDAGDNVKYGLPMAFTVTTLAWSTLAYKKELQAVGEFENAVAGIKWGTDYFLKASSRRNRLYVQVGDPELDHQCWVRPEVMQTPRTVLQIDEKDPGTEIAAETSAAMAAASMVFRSLNHTYARRLLNKAKLLFTLAKAHKATYDGECPFYCSYSGYNDELMWAATWLYMASKKSMYLKYVMNEAINANVAEFSWDLKYAGAQILLSQFFFQGEQGLASHKNGADSFICSNHPESPYHQVYISPGGVLHLRDGANSQYVTGAALLFSVYSDILRQYNQKVNCGDKQLDADSLMSFAHQQMDYLLGNNPQKRSYMVGFGNNPPKEPHHRGASVPRTQANQVVSCPMSFVYWFNQNGPNPNELTGAFVGGPDKLDNFVDKRSASSFTEPCTYVNSLAVGVLAKLAAHA
ncbi:endoglucanase 16 [Ricinus communis]|uniref:Endoglucanase n=1 Tax=Ricinus communis TaxID=3988 RepID=B9RQY0_RICCO|nr:endoglucanase 16 [Ricinus communis]EEF46151.1 endo-1,4-beta-glucanase, putative [Ricinus communis]|eukprot:XP_002516149.1 endoglucanase 16 [Ricinus communis]